MRDGGVGAGGVPESESERASVAGGREAREEKSEKLKRAVVDGVWKSILEPAQEYALVSSRIPLDGAHADLEPALRTSSALSSIPAPYLRQSHSSQ